MVKRSLRRAALARRERLAAAERLERGGLIAEALMRLSEFERARTVMLYASIGSEVPTGELVAKCAALGKRIVLPAARPGGRLVPALVHDVGQLVPGSFGIPEPVVERTGSIEPAEIDLVIVPGVAFCRRGYRLGYGGGYYDRFLEQLPQDIPRIALAFSVQIQECLEHEPHDIPVDKIVTEDGALACHDGVCFKD